MKDKLEKFISENRRDFDDQEPGSEIWKKIDKTLPAKKAKIVWLSVAWKATAIAAIAAIAFIAGSIMWKDNHYTNVALTASNSTKTITREKIESIEKVTLPELYIAVSNNTNVNPITKKSLNTINPEIEEAEAFYSTRIDQKERELNQYTASNPELRTQINKEFKQLDSVYVNLRMDLKDNVNNSEVIEAMIQNYRVRLSILEDMLAQLKENEIKEKKNTHDEK